MTGISWPYSVPERVWIHIAAAFFGRALEGGTSNIVFARNSQARSLAHSEVERGLQMLRLLRSTTEDGAEPAPTRNP